MALTTGMRDDKYDYFRPSSKIGSQSPLIGLEAEIADKGQARLCL